MNEFTFSTWLTSIAKNLHVDLIRKEKIHQSTDVDEVGRDVIDETLGPEDQLIRSQNLDKLLHKFDRLNPFIGRNSTAFFRNSAIKK